jgi:hypothetical protein
MQMIAEIMDVIKKKGKGGGGGGGKFDPARHADDIAASKAVNPGVQMMKKGGSASARADGCAVKGKTKGRMV